MKKSEELNVFLEKAEEFIESKYILADVKIANLLKAIVTSDTLLAIFKNCLADFDYEEAKKKYLIKSKYLADDKGEFVMPQSSRELLAFVFSVLADIDAKRLALGEFLNKYFYEDGSFATGYMSFINSMIKPFRNSVKMLMESVIEGKLQDPVEAFTQEENRKAKEKEIEQQKKLKEKELSQKVYASSVKEIKKLLLEDKTKIKKKENKIKEEVSNGMLLIIDMLANVIESDDKDAINYAFISYKYMAKVHKLLFMGRIKKISKAVKDILNEL